MHSAVKSIILLSLSIQSFCCAAAESSKNIKITSNSPIKAGERLKIDILLPASAEKTVYQFNGETHFEPKGLLVFNASKYAVNYAKKNIDTDACFGESISGVGKYQTLFSTKFPQDNKSYSIWLRAKGEAVCLRSAINGKSKELKWSWGQADEYIWRYLGRYNKEQIGSTFSFMTGGKKPFANIDCVLLSTDKNYKPNKKDIAPNIFYWQSNASSIGTHQMNITVTRGNVVDKRKISVTVLPKSSSFSLKNIELPKNSWENIPLGKNVQSVAKNSDFNIFNQSYLDFFNKPWRGIKFSIKPELIALKCKKYDQLPSFAIIPVKRKFAGLGFLHTEYWQGDTGTKMAFYRVNYKDSTNVDIPIREDYEIAGSLRNPETKNAFHLFKAGSNSIDFHVSLFVWKNPYPNKEIENITFSNLLSRYSKEENKLIPLNVTSMTSQILLNVIGIKSLKAVDTLVGAQSKTPPKKCKLTAEVTCNFGNIRGEISPNLFSTNETGIMNTSTLDFADYKQKMLQVGCKMFRLHGGWRLQSIYPEGIDGPHKFAKLDTGIKNVLKGPGKRIIMICINYIPKYINPLKEKDRQHFADLCVDLLKHLKKENIPVKYWEIYNEEYFRGIKEDRSLWKMYNLTAKKLKQCDPSIKVGGYAPCWPTISGLKDFYKHCHQNVDFISWHKYLTGSSKTPDSYIMNNTNSFGKDTTAIRKMVQKVTPGKKIEYALTEYNINWNWKPHDPRQANNKGAVWLASVLYHLIKARADIALTWHSRQGGTFGLLSGANKIRPTAELLYLCNRYLKTDYVASQSNDKLLECLGFIQPGKHIGLLLINKSAQTIQVKISTLNLPSLPVNYFEDNAIEYTIGSTGFSRKKSNINKEMEKLMKPYEVIMVVAKIANNDNINFNQ